MTNHSLLYEELLPQAEERFLVRDFRECLEYSSSALSLISHPITRDLQIPWKDDATAQEYAQIRKEPKNNKGDREIKQERLEIVLRKLNSLYHECSECADEGEQLYCDCIQFVMIVVQSLFELKELNPQIVMTFLWNFYGNINSIPFKVLFLSLNGMIKRGQLEEAKNVLNFCLQPKKLPLKHIRDQKNGDVSIQEISNHWKPLEIDEYDQFIQLLLFHVLSPLNKWEEGIAILDVEQFLPQWKVDSYRIHLNMLKEEASSNQRRKNSLKSKEFPEISSENGNETSLPKLESKTNIPNLIETPISSKQDTPTSTHIINGQGNTLSFFKNHFMKNFKVWAFSSGISFILLFLFFGMKSQSATPVGYSYGRKQRSQSVSTLGRFFGLFSSLFQYGPGTSLEYNSHN